MLAKLKNMLTKMGVGVAALTLLAGSAWGSRVGDLTRLGGDMPNELVGIGLVVGLKGTGDGGNSLPTIRPLQQMLGRFDDPVTLAAELKNANNVALVKVSVNVPAHGVRVGDKLDVRVSSGLSAKSLKGGRLFLCPLRGPDPRSKTIFALASGDVMLDDEGVPTQGRIRSGATGGAVMQRDILMDNTVDGKFALVLQPTVAGFENATAIADQINEDVMPQTDGRAVATAVDAMTVVVQIPKAEAARPAQFIARVKQLHVPNLPGGARVLINSKTKTIVFTGEVEVAPTMISQNGLMITVAAPNVPVNPPGSQVPFMALDPGKQGGAKLKDLVEAFNLLKVTAEDRIAIIKELHNSGALRCQLQID